MNDFWDFPKQSRVFNLIIGAHLSILLIFRNALTEFNQTCTDCSTESEDAHLLFDFFDLIAFQVFLLQNRDFNVIREFFGKVNEGDTGLLWKTHSSVLLFIPVCIMSFICLLMCFIPVLTLSLDYDI